MRLYITAEGVAIEGAHKLKGEYEEKGEEA